MVEVGGRSVSDPHPPTLAPFDKELFLETLKAICAHARARDGVTVTLLTIFQVRRFVGSDRRRPPLRRSLRLFAGSRCWRHGAVREAASRRFSYGIGRSNTIHYQGLDRGERVMDLDFVWHLPQSHRDEKIYSQLSADAQIYVRCTNCSSEARVDASFASADFSDAKCKSCGKNGMKLVRHLQKITYRCQDCSEEFTRHTSPSLMHSGTRISIPVSGPGQLVTLPRAMSPRSPARASASVAPRSKKFM